MHNSLGGLPPRAVLDTNVLLDATFVDGMARQAVLGLRAIGLAAIVDEATWQEARVILGRLRTRLALQFDPFPYVEAFASRVGLVFVPPAPLVIAAGVNRADRLVASAAKHYDGWLLTGDSPLIVECKSVGVEGRLPWDVIVEGENTPGQPPPDRHIVRMAPLGTTSGSIFARVTPSGWSGSTHAGQFTVCEVEGLGLLYHDTARETWVFAMDSLGLRVEVASPVAVEETWAVCATYRLPGTAQRGNVSLRLGRFPDTVRSASTPTLKHIRSLDRSTVQLGSDLSGANNWNGYIRAFITGTQTMSAGTWKALVAIPEGAPNPYDEDALTRALQLLATRMSEPSVYTGPTDRGLF